MFIAINHYNDCIVSRILKFPCVFLMYVAFTIAKRLKQM